MTTEIHIELLDEGSPVLRPTEGVEEGNGIFRVLPTADYNSEDEIWAFPPGSLVVCERKQLKWGGEIIVATRLAETD